MKISVFILLAVLPSLPARTFTSSDGRTLEAEFVAVSGDVVTLVLPNGKRVKLPVSALSDDDQKFVREQKPSQDAPEVYSSLGMNAVIAEFDKETSLDVLEMSKEQEEAYWNAHNIRISRETTTTNYTFTFTNGLSQPIPDATVEYTVYRREVIRGKGRQFFTHEPTEVVPLGTMEPKEEKVIESPAYTGHELSLTYGETPEKNYKGDTSHVGVLFTVKTGNEIINKFAYPKGFDIRVKEAEDLAPIAPAPEYPTWPPTP